MIDPLEVAGHHSVTLLTFCDERERAALGVKVSPDAFASVTFSARDTSWGEFMDRDQVLALYGWLGLLLAGGDHAA